MKNREIARILNEVADILEFQEIEWKPRAYRTAARKIEDLDEDIESIYSKGGKKGLEKIPGVGKAISEHIAEYLDTGKVMKFENLMKKVPGGVHELIEIYGLGPSKSRKLMHELGIKNVEDLKKAIEKHKIRDLEGFGEKTEQNIKQAISEYEKSHERMLIMQAMDTAREIISYLSSNAKIEKINYAGSLRRMKETIGDIDMLVQSDDKEISETFVKMPDVERVVSRGSTKISVVLKSSVNVDMRLIKPESYGAALMYFTGSKDHNISLRKRAIEMGMKLSEYGLFDKKSGKMVAGKTEEEVYKKLKLDFIPPELRENRGEIGAAEKGILPHLIELRDIMGDLQMHTKYSDGSATIEQMASAAKEKGYEYIAITDHSKSQHIARGMEESKLERQIKEIDRVSEKMDIMILKGAEVDILPDGSLDYPDKILKKLDIVVGSVHSRFKSSKQEMTKRIVSALENEYLSILGHPTGRLLGRRAGYDADFEKIFSRASEKGKIMEINADPERLDLNDVMIMAAKQYGLKFCINTDAHAISGLDSMKYGVGQARRGWLEKKDVINTYRFRKISKILGLNT